ncbi:MAG TPA: hypothetical protein VLH81_01585, partial [Desulfobacterales bacterium]|nr:hypothetical protein [Desulfobacterales bacterium]
MDPMLTPQLMEAGARYGTERAPDPVTLGWLQEECIRLERVLRLQYDEGQLPGDWEAELATTGSPGDTTSALRRWSALKHFYRVRWHGLAARTERADGDAAAAARALLRREPIIIQLAGETVAVTGRSYSAMMEIAAHDIRLQGLDEAIARVTSLAARVGDALSRTPVLGAWGRRRTLGARLTRLAGIYERLATEREAHRCAIYAHALTPHGGPAEDPLAEAPAWWRRAGPVDDVELLGALFLAGPARIAALPEPKKPDEEKPNEFGGASLFTFFERRHMLE